LLFLYAIGHPVETLSILDFMRPFIGSKLVPELYWIFLLSSSLILGHLLSTLVRSVERNLINWLLGDPENAVMPKSENDTSLFTEGRYFTEQFRELFASKYKSVFQREIETEPATAVPRLVRSYVFHYSESARSSRDRIVRGRSFCANMALACIIGSALNYATFDAAVHLSLWLVAALLIIKQRSLDVREAKEIYSHFLAIQQPK
jgi:hypothetical protein